MRLRALALAAAVVNVLAIATAPAAHADPELDWLECSGQLGNTPSLFTRGDHTGFLSIFCTHDHYGLNLPNTETFDDTWGTFTIQNSDVAEANASFGHVYHSVGAVWFSSPSEDYELHFDDYIVADVPPVVDQLEMLNPSQDIVLHGHDRWSDHPYRVRTGAIYGPCFCGQYGASHPMNVVHIHFVAEYLSDLPAVTEHVGGT